MQAQEFYPALWGIGQRTANLAEADVERAFNAGEIVRTHVMRPTWHFAAPEDIRWLLMLTGPRVNATCATYYRKLELDAATLSRARRTLVKALRGRHAPRALLRDALRRATIPVDTMRFAFILMHVELEGLMISGPRVGKQFTYALLDERVPAAAALTPEEALATLTRRYFAGHGPATIRDFAWWSGLTTKQIREGIALIGSELHSEEIEGDTFWRSAGAPAAPRRRPTAAHLLPVYDELFIGYKDRRTADTFAAPLVVAGRVAGSWRRQTEKQRAVVSIALSAPLSAPERRAVDRAVRRYQAFLGIPVVLDFPTTG